MAEWADRHRRLSPENSAESGPVAHFAHAVPAGTYGAFTDPKIRKIVMVAASQVGKSELELNIIGLPLSTKIPARVCDSICSEK